MHERLINLAVNNLEYMGSINFDDYSIEKRYSGVFIKEFNKEIGVIVDGIYYINGFFKKFGFEDAVMKNSQVFLDVIEQRIKEQNKKLSDLDFKCSRLETEKKELEEKIAKKIEEETKETIYSINP